MTTRERGDEAGAAGVRGGTRWSWSFGVGLGVGWAVTAYGLWGLLDDADRTNPRELVVWVIGSAVAHDALLAPIVTIVGVALAAMLPAVLRGPVRVALAVSGIVVLFAYPLLRGFGRRAGNSSTLPHDYGRNVLLVLALVWGFALAAVLLRWFRAARRARPGSAPASAC